MTKTRRPKSDSAAYAAAAHQNAAQAPIAPPPYLPLPAPSKPFWHPTVTTPPRDT